MMGLQKWSFLATFVSVLIYATFRRLATNEKEAKIVIFWLN